MERNRVEDIKKKFEGLNQSPERNVNGLDKKINRPVVRPFGAGASSQNNQTDKQSSNLLRATGNIKRSHAFRSEKQTRPAFSTSLEAASSDLQDIINAHPYKATTSRNNVEYKEINLEEKHLNRKRDFNYMGFPDSNFQLPNASSQCSYSSVVKNVSKARIRKKALDESLSPVINSNKSSSFRSPIVNRNVTNEFDNISRSSIDGKKDNVDAFLNISPSNTPCKLRCDIPVVKPARQVGLYMKDDENERECTSNIVTSNKCSENDFLSNTKLKEVLTAPLPRGPPPKKPPRTFAHNLENRLESTNEFAKPVKSQSSSKFGLKRIDKSDLKPVRSKTESQIMLKKLENYLLTHQNSVPVAAHAELKSSAAEVPSSSSLSPRHTDISDRIENLNHTFKVKQFNKSLPLPQTPESDMNVRSKDCSSDSNLCFNLLNCTRPPLYENPFLKKSNFFIKSPNLNVVDVGCETGSKPYGTIKRSASEEHVYAEPVQSTNRPSDVSSSCKTLKSGRVESNRWARRHESLPDSDSLDKNILDKSFDYGLHYMSTPIDASSLNVNKTENIKSAPEKEKLNEAVNVKVNLFNNLSVGTAFALNLNMDKRDGGVQHEGNSSIDRQSIQILLNEAYGNRSTLHGTADNGSDSDSVVSTPDESTALNSKQKTEPIMHKDREQMTAERKGYVRRVSSRLTSVHRSHNQSPDQFPHLFECLLLVGLDLDPARCKVPYIKSRFPESITAPRIEELCFPDANDWPPPPGSGQSYAQVLTDSNGVRKFGYCRRVQPEGAAVCLPLAYCIITPFKANAFYNKVLMELESKHGQSDLKVNQFIQQLYQCPFPPLGHGLFVPQSPYGERVEILRRPLDSRQEDSDLADLLMIVKLSVFLQIFATLLHERKVILLSESISKLSICVEGLQSCLFPFHWQHTLVPILPSILMDVCEAPTPYLIGIIKPKLMDVPFNNLDLDLVVDVDEGVVVHSKGDEGWILPSRLSRGLRSALQLSLTAGPETANLLASEAVIRLFVELVGHYREHISISAQTKKREFQRDSFVKSVSSRSVQLFLEWFTETAMFNAFIQSRVDRSADSRGIFEQRCSEYVEENDHGRLVKNYKALNKTVKNLGDRFKDWAALS